jgi:uncharacterized membrane protein YkvI
MGFMKSNAFKKYFVPGIILQSVVIAGGYGTGRELVEFFLNFGTVGGLLGTIVSLAVWAVVCVATFEFARVFRVFDYRSLFQKLLGRGWVLFEICYLVLMAIVLGVIAAASGSILNEMFGLNFYVGVVGLLVGVGLLVYNGSEAIERFLSYWSFVLYGVYILFLVVLFAKFGGNISANLAAGEVKSGFALNGFKYAWYNLGCVPALLFSLNTLENRKDSIISGILAAVITIVPAVLLLLGLISHYPEVTAATVPTNFILEMIGSKTLQVVFQITLFGTLIETGAGFINAVIGRIESVYKEKGKELPKAVNLGTTIALLVMGVIIAQFGLVGLIAKGYGTITWGFFLFYTLPIVTLGIYKIAKQGGGAKTA